jgi:peptidoglycan-associated lipoprotein
MQLPRASTGRALRITARRVVFFAIFFSGGGSLLGACGAARYPACDNDEQCRSETHKGVCVNHLCTQCRDDAQCGKGQECRAGACATIADYCEDDKGCGGGSSCGKDHRCRKELAVAPPPVECDEQHACQGSSHCENGHCVAPPHGGPGCSDFPAPRFDYESPEIRADGKQVLERLAKCVVGGSLKGARLLLTGHCDPRGEYEYNMGLGAERAESIKTFLAGLGVPGGEITTSSRGKLDATGVDEAGWSNDRRVDIEVR